MIPDKRMYTIDALFFTIVERGKANKILQHAQEMGAEHGRSYWSRHLMNTVHRHPPGPTSQGGAGRSALNRPRLTPSCYGRLHLSLAKRQGNRIHCPSVNGRGELPASPCPINSSSPSSNGGSVSVASKAPVMQVRSGDCHQRPWGRDSRPLLSIGRRAPEGHSTGLGPHCTVRRSNNTSLPTLAYKAPVRG